VGFAYTRRLRHERWLTIHRPVGALFLMAAVNFTILESGTPSGFRAAPYLDDSADAGQRGGACPIESFCSSDLATDMTILWKVWIRARTTLSTC